MEVILMEKILISIDGTQNFGKGDTNNVELTTTGELNVLPDSYTLKYEESELTGMEGTTTEITVSNTGVVSLSRKGTVNSNLVFEEGQRHLSYYDTKDGAFSIGVFASYVDTVLEQNYGEINITYAMDVDDKPIGENEIRVRFNR
jgi:uncharacterized beta-barrel protein YwiB (DUF1934 family)